MPNTSGSLQNGAMAKLRSATSAMDIVSWRKSKTFTPFTHCYAYWGKRERRKPRCKSSRLDSQSAKFFGEREECQCFTFYVTLALLPGQNLIVQWDRFPSSRKAIWQHPDARD
jgi:hypothetical protein